MAGVISSYTPPINALKTGATLWGIYWGYLWEEKIMGKKAILEVTYVSPVDAQFASRKKHMPRNPGWILGSGAQFHINDIVHRGEEWCPCCCNSNSNYLKGENNVGKWHIKIRTFFSIDSMEFSSCPEDLQWASGNLLHLLYLCRCIRNLHPSSQHTHGASQRCRTQLPALGVSLCFLCSPLFIKRPRLWTCFIQALPSTFQLSVMPSLLWWLQQQ